MIHTYYDKDNSLYLIPKFNNNLVFFVMVRSQITMRQGSLNRNPCCRVKLEKFLQQIKSYTDQINMSLSLQCKGSTFMYVLAFPT